MASVVIADAPVWGVAGMLRYGELQGCLLISFPVIGMIVTPLIRCEDRQGDLILIPNQRVSI